MPKCKSKRVWGYSHVLTLQDPKAERGRRDQGGSLGFSKITEGSRRQSHMARDCCLLKLSPGGAGRPLLGVWKPQGCPEAALPPDCSIRFDAATALQRDTQDGSAAKAIAC